MKTTPTPSFFGTCIVLFFVLIVFPLKASEVDSTTESSIEFVKFEAVVSSRIVHFKWDVVAEVNGDYFVIEKSSDEGATWHQLARVKSIENHKERHTYEVSEINMTEVAHELFRICRVDALGNHEVLDEVDVNHPVLINMKLIPDPKKVNKSVTVSCESLIESKGTLYIYDAKGELVKVEEMNLIDGYNRIEISTKNYVSGEYLFVVRNDFNDAVSRSMTVY